MNSKSYSHARARLRRAAAAAPHVRCFAEDLEARRLFAVTVQSINGGDDLVITGDLTKSDNITIYADPDNGPHTIVKDNVTGKVWAYDATFDSIDITTGGGNDKVAFVVLSDYFNVAQAVDAELGTGQDTFTLSCPSSGGIASVGTNAATGQAGASPTPTPALFAASDGGDFNGSDVSFNVNGEANNDTITFDIRKGLLYGSRLQLTADGSTESDTINLWLPDHVYATSNGGEEGVYNADDGSQLIANLNTGGCGSTGQDVVNISAPVHIDGSTVEIDVEGGVGKDVVNCDLAPQTERDGSDTIPSEFKLDVNTYGANDKMTAYMDYSGGTLVASTSVKPAGNPAPGRGIINDGGCLQHYGFSGGTGDDSCKFFCGVFDVISGSGKATRYTNAQVSNPLFGATEFDIHGGSGKDTLVIDLDTPSGTTVDNADSFIQIFNFDETFLGTINIQINGDSDNDRLETDLNPYGIGIIDWVENGGTGNDQLIMASNMLGIVIPNGPSFAVQMNGGTGSDEWDVDGLYNNSVPIASLVVNQISLETEHNELEGAAAYGFDNT